MRHSPNQITIGLLQLSLSPLGEENLKKVQREVQAAAERGAEVVCLPELFRTRYFCQVENPALWGLAEPIPGPTTELLSSLARKFGVVIIGSIYERDRENRFNTAVLIDSEGRFLGKYRKIHIPDDLKNYYGETFYFKKGDLGYPIFETEYGKIGLQVCYDQWFPEGARALALGGAEIIIYPTAIGWSDSGGLTSLTGRTGPTEEQDAWVTVQRAHAISNGVFVACCNRVGSEDHINFWGTSFVCDPMGKILAQAAPDKEQTLVVECDLSRIDVVRRDWPFLKEC